MTLKIVLLIELFLNPSNTRYYKRLKLTSRNKWLISEISKAGEFALYARRICAIRIGELK